MNIRVAFKKLSMSLLLAATISLPSSCYAEAATRDVRAGGSAHPTMQPIHRGDDVERLLGGAPSLLQDGPPAQLTAKERRAIATVHTDPGEVPQLKVAIDGKELALPLDHTHVAAQITGNVARVEVTQTYQNPFAYPIEAIYIFPLPENSAVDDMKIKIGDRVIIAEIQKRAEARQTYETAKQQGHTAALLEQERPNIFTQSVANIEPGTKIDIVIRYAQDLTYDAGEYEFVFPMVVGPRFIPGRATGQRSGTGYAQDTGEVPDASRITPPVLGGGLRSGHDISLELVANAGVPITTWDVPTHDTRNTPTYDGTLKLALEESDAIPNRDFVLEYHVDGKQPQAALLTHRDEGDGYFSLMVQPPKLDVDDLVGQREIIFVIDVSGSMSGVPLSMCKDAMAEALGKLRPVDTFNVITFESRTGKLFERPYPANDTNLKAATEFVDGMRAGGGTMMGLGVQEALSPNVEPGRHRYVFFMTDGYIGNEKAIMQGTRKLVRAIEGRGQRAKVFSFGTGSSTNRHLLDGLARAGRGIAVYSSTREDPALAVNEFYRIIDHSIMRDLVIDWGDLQVDEVYPSQLPDLFASRPLLIHGRYHGSGKARVTIRGKAGRAKVAIPVDVALAGEETNNAVLSSLWARAKIGSLSRDIAYNGPSQRIVDEITDLGLEHRLVTAYTSFVAVDRSRTIDGELHTITQPVEAPEGVDARAAGALVPKSRSKAPAQTFGAYGMGARNHGSAGGMVRSERKRLYRAPATKPTSRQYAKSFDAADAESGGAGRPVEMTPMRDAPEPASREELAGSEAAAGGLKVRGALHAALVRAVIESASARSAVRACYEQSAAGTASGTMRVHWFITATGVVIQVKVTGDSLGDAKLNRCVRRAVQSWRFGRPTDGAPVEVTYTFRF